MRQSHSISDRCVHSCAPSMSPRPSRVSLDRRCLARRSRAGAALGALVVAGRGAAPAAAKPRRRAPRRVVAPKLDVKSWELANGLKVLFLADHKAPIATVQVFYHVGSKDEHVGIRGVAHMFEHMMFKGSEHVPPEEHARLLKEVGGQVNAFTTEDVTAYHDTVPPSYVDFAMQLEAERMRHLKLFPETDRLRAQGRRGGEAPARRQQPDRQGDRALPRAGLHEAPLQLDGHRHHRGSRQGHARRLPEVLRHLLPAQQRDADRRRRRRRGRRCAGWSRSTSARSRAAPAPPRDHGRGAAADARRARETLDDPGAGARSSSAATTSRAPPIPTLPPLEVLAAILSGGESSRLHQRLVRKDHLAIAAGGLVETHGGSGAVPRLRRLPARSRSRPRSGGAARRGRARARPSRSPPPSWTRRRTSWPPATSSACRPSTASRTQLGQYQYVNGDWREFLKGAAATWR